METLKQIVNILKIIGISIAGISFIAIMIKIATEPEMKSKYLKLTKHLLMATVFITISLSIIEIPKKYYGNKIEIVDDKTADATIEDLKDADCQGRETVNVNGRWYVVTDSGKKLGALGEGDSLDDVSVVGFYDTAKVVENVSFLRRFSECQDFWKGYFAETVYYRDGDGLIFPREYTYSDYIRLKESQKQQENTEGGDSNGN